MADVLNDALPRDYLEDEGVDGSNFSAAKARQEFLSGGTKDSSDSNQTDTERVLQVAKSRILRYDSPEFTAVEKRYKGLSMPLSFVFTRDGKRLQIVATSHVNQLPKSEKRTVLSGIGTTLEGFNDETQQEGDQRTYIIEGGLSKDKLAGMTEEEAIHAGGEPALLQKRRENERSHFISPDPTPAEQTEDLIKRLGETVDGIPTRKILAMNELFKSMSGLIGNEKVFQKEQYEKAKLEHPEQTIPEFHSTNKLRPSELFRKIYSLSLQTGWKPLIEDPQLQQRIETFRQETGGIYDKEKTVMLAEELGEAAIRQYVQESVGELQNLLSAQLGYEPTYAFMNLEDFSWPLDPDAEPEKPGEDNAFRRRELAVLGPESMMITKKLTDGGLFRNERLLDAIAGSESTSMFALYGASHVFAVLDAVQALGYMPASETMELLTEQQLPISA